MHDTSFRHGHIDKLSTEIIGSVSNFTMTTPLAIFNLLSAVKYVSENKIEGDIVECGVWRGGSCMAAAHALQSVREPKKKLWLYDTFDGMPPSTDRDVNFKGLSAETVREKRMIRDGGWCRSSIEEVRANIASTGFPGHRSVYVEGNVEDTLPNITPKSISILRIDTDFYQSTYWILKCLYPILSTGGVCILDDYDCWLGAKDAVDEYFHDEALFPLLMRMDSGRLLVKK